jgi:hypothetical protein
MALHMVDSANEDFFLVRVTDSSGELRYHGVGTLADIVDRIGDAAYDVHDGGEADHFTVFALSSHIPYAIDVEYVIHVPIGYTEVKFSWDTKDAVTRSVVRRRESGYFKTPGV